MLSLEMQSTGFPQNLFTVCISCSKQIFFERKYRTLLNIDVVEKNFAKMLLIRLNSAYIILGKLITDAVVSINE